MNARHVVIDGYNLMHAHPDYAVGEGGDFDAARARLVADLAGYAQGGPRTIVVFDGAANPHSDGAPHHVGRLTVIFSPAGRTADETIEALAQRFRERGEETLVITSDSATRDTVRSGSITVAPSAQFATELASEAAAARSAARTGRRMPLSGRIDPDVAATLGRWARGSAAEPRGD